MKRKEMLMLLRRGVSPIDIAIKKWKDIVEHNGVDEMSSNCALCEVHGESDSEECGDCPILPFTECKGTPQNAWLNHHFKAHQMKRTTKYEFKIECAICKKWAERELTFLQLVKQKQEGEEQ